MVLGIFVELLREITQSIAIITARLPADRARHPSKSLTYHGAALSSFTSIALDLLPPRRIPPPRPLLNGIRTRHPPRPLTVAVARTYAGRYVVGAYRHKPPGRPFVEL